MSELACIELVEEVTDYLEGALSPAQRARFEAHLEECPFCTDYLDQMRATVARLGTPDRARLSADARAGILDAFRRRDA
jgi:anti-sigma factor RsiW